MTTSDIINVAAASFNGIAVIVSVVAVVLDRLADLVQRRAVAAVLVVALVGIVRVGQQADTQHGFVFRAHLMSCKGK